MIDLQHRRWLGLGALAAAMTAGVSGAQAASFPCDRAGSAVEKAICSSPETSDLDEYLGRYYVAARSRLGHADACLVADQRAWLRTVRDACRDTPCLKAAYLDRLATLDALQPGATRLRGIELPKRPSLVWVLAPAADEVAAPRHRPTVPLVAAGVIVDEVAGGDGYVLRTAAGTRHLLVPLMFLEQPTRDALAGLARLPGASYEVRGQADAADADAGAGRAFASGQCAYVYRRAP